MFDIIKNIISHVWDTSGSGLEQTIIYCICGSMILLFSIWILDRISVFIISCAKGGR